MANDFAIYGTYERSSSPAADTLDSLFLRCDMDLPVAELLFEAISRVDSSYMSDEEYTLYSEFKNKLLDTVREMK